MRRLLGLALVAAIVGYLGWPYAVTIVSIEDDGAQAGTFDPAAYVDGVWERLESTIRDESVDLASILGAMRPNETGFAQKDELTTVAEEFGLITAGEAHVYMVRATGTVTAVAADTSLGTLELSVEGYEGPVVVEVYIGPRIPSDESSIRDAVGFISFGDFREQTEYGKVASEINRRVSEALSSLDPAQLDGARIRLFGAMTIRTFNLVEIDVRQVSVVPLWIEIE